MVIQILFLNFFEKKKKILFLNLIEPIQRVYPMIGEPTINSSMRFGFTPL